MSANFNTKNMVAGLSLCGVLAMGAIAAYFTDTDTVSNKFIVGKIDIDLTEPTWDSYPDEDGDGVPDIAESITPNKEIAKDPTITNIGENDAYIFAKVCVPYGNLETAQNDGTTNPATKSELFSYTPENGWLEINIEEDAENGVIIHTYAYADENNELVPVVKDDAVLLFNSVRFANILNDSQTGVDMEGKLLNLNVSAFGIQTTDVLDGEGHATKDAVSVWNILNKQLESGENRIL